MEECGLVFQIRVKPQRDLGSLLSVVRERDSWLVLHNAYEIWMQVIPRVLFFPQLESIWCAWTLFSQMRNCSKQGRAIMEYWIWKLSYAQILCLTSNLNLKNWAGLFWMPREWVVTVKKKKKKLWKLTPPFLMIPTTGIQAADIISKSLNQNWWEIPSCHILAALFTVLYFDCWTWWISIVKNISFRPSEWFPQERQQSGSSWRRTVLPAKYFPWPLHMVKAISQ